MTLKDKYQRSGCINKSEELIKNLCDRAFFKLWTYPNLFKKSGKELCDCLIIFENNVFIFSIKESKYNGKTQDIAWKRWKRETIDGCIRQIDGAEKWIKKYPEKIFLDSKCQNKMPIKINPNNVKIYRFIVAMGIEQNIGVLYSDENHGIENNIGIFQTSRKNIYHLLDSANLEIILNELDTINDFLNFFIEKEKVISRLNNLGYYGESSLLALYMQNMDEQTGEHKILPPLFYGDEFLEKENLWTNIENNPQYLLKKIEDKNSYIIDFFIEKSINFELKGELLGNVDIQHDLNPIKEISKETRFQRRILGKSIIGMLDKYWEMEEQTRFVRFTMSENDNKAYVILLNTFSDKTQSIEENRTHLKIMLEIACGSLKNIKPELNQITGIAFIPDKNLFSIGEDYILLNCQEWNKEDEYYYNKLNEAYNFWKKGIKSKVVSFDEYPQLQ